MGLMRKVTQLRMSLYKFHYYQIALCSLITLVLILTYTYVNKNMRPSFVYHNTHEDNKQALQEAAGLFGKRMHKNSEPEICEILNLQPKMKSVHNNIEQPGCKRIPPVPDSCSIAEEIFFSEPLATCSHYLEFNICQLKRSPENGWVVLCSEKAGEKCVSPLSVGTIDQKTGSLLWEKVGTPSEVAKKLTALLQFSDVSKPKHYGFCFIRCRTKSEVSLLPTERYGYVDNDVNIGLKQYDDIQQIEENSYIEQLLILPPQVKDVSTRKIWQHNDISINVILVDSVSRQHFFRSMKQSVTALQKLLNSSTALKATVLDFQLVQAVRSRTFETLQTIFSGDIDPSVKPFGTQDIPPQPLKLSALLNKFKAKDYHTLWLEDLCYLWEWGISKDLHFLNKSSNSEDTWIRMWQKLAENQIDSIDVTLAMCRVLDANGVVDHFHGPDSVCFNHRHQHEYLLEYLLLYQQTMESLGQPYFTFTMTNVAHEDTGRRVQTLDDALARYLTSAANLQNSLTIIFSDHGNAYGRFMEATPEARIELFNPFMFFIVPRNVVKQLGYTAMKSLEVNTHRLVSFLDLHHTLNHIMAPTSRFTSLKSTRKQFKISLKGLFELIDINRTCDDIPRIMPNLCICQDYDSPVDNNTDSNLFAYYAVGRLNDEIQRQFQSESSKHLHPKPVQQKHSGAAFGNCEKLKLYSVQNIRRRFNQDRSQIIKMDLHVQQGQIFFVAMSVKRNIEGQGYHKIVLEMYDRITPFSKFAACADDIDLSLCICSTRQTNLHSNSLPLADQLGFHPLLPKFEVLVQDLNSVVGNCLLLVTVKHVTHGAVIFAANLCKDKRFVLRIFLEADDTVVYSCPPQALLVMAEGVGVVGLIYSEKGEEWSCSVKVESQIRS